VTRRSHGPLGDLGGVDPQHPLVLLVGHRLQAFAQQVTTGTLEERGDQPAPLQGDDLPPGGVEHRLQPLDLDVRDDPVQRLAVEVDDPQQLAQAGDLRIGDGLPDRPLVELGVAQQADETSRRRCVREARSHVAVGDRRPQGRGCPDPDRAGRKVTVSGSLERDG
jgi:hypothetical protein